MEYFVNPGASPDGYAGYFTADDYARVEAFSARHPQLGPTPLIPCRRSPRASAFARSW